MKKLLAFLFLVTSSIVASDNSYNLLYQSIQDSCNKKYCGDTQLLKCLQKNQETINQCTRRGVLKALQNKCQAKTPSCSAQELRILSMYSCQSTVCPLMSGDCFKKHEQEIQNCALLSYPEKDRVLVEAQQYCMNSCYNKYDKTVSKGEEGCVNSCILTRNMESCFAEGCTAEQITVYQNWLNKTFIPMVRTGSAQVLQQKQAELAEELK